MNAFLLYNLSMYSYTIKDYIESFNDNSLILHSSAITPDRAKVKVITNAPIFDISYSSIRELQRLFEVYDITNVTFFTYQSSYDKLIYGICKRLGIKTTFHDHGIVNGNQPGKGQLTFSHFFHKGGAIIKRFLHIQQKKRELKNMYLKGKSDFTPIKLLFDSDFKKYSFDNALFFSQNNFEVHQTIINIDNTKYKIGGLPVFRFNSERNMSIACSRERAKQVLYILQPLIKLGFTKIGFNDEINYIIALSRIMNQKKYILKLRLHPAQEKEPYKEALKHTSIVISEEPNLNADLLESSIILGHWSTAILTAVALRKRLYVLKYPDLYPKYEKFNQMFKELSCNNNIVDNLNDLTKIHFDSVLKYNAKTKIEYFVGSFNTYEHNYFAFQNLTNDE